MWIEKDDCGEIIRAINNATYDDIFKMLKPEIYSEAFVHKYSIRDTFSEVYHEEFDTAFDAYMGDPEAKEKIKQMIDDFTSDMARDYISDYWEEVDDDFVIEWEK